MNILLCCVSKCLLIACGWLTRVILMKASNKRNAFSLISVTMMKAF